MNMDVVSKAGRKFMQFIFEKVHLNSRSSNSNTHIVCKVRKYRKGAREEKSWEN